MAPVATVPSTPAKGYQPNKQAISQLANPFYSPAGEEDNDETYKFVNYKVHEYTFSTM